MNKEISMGKFLGDLGINGVVRVNANELRELIKIKFSLDREVSQLRHKCKQLETQVSFLKDEIEILKKNKESGFLVTGLNGTSSKKQNTYKVFSDDVDCIFRKWYVVNEDNRHGILYSQSSDGVEWSEGIPIVIIGKDFNSVTDVNIESVEKVDGVYSIVFSVTRNNKTTEHYITSTDCLHWEISS